VRRALPAALALALLAPLGAAQDQDQVIDVRSTRPSAGNSFEALWGAFRKAEAAGEAEKARGALEEIRRLRVERNIRSLEEIALVFVARGVAALSRGDRAQAEEEFGRAISVDPQLPDGYFGRASSEVRSLPFGIVPAMKDVISGTTARLSTSPGRYDWFVLFVAVGCLSIFATTTVLAIAMLVRHGSLLLHDLEESFAATRGRAFALGVYGVLLLLPLVTFQGFAWLPLWWLALLFIYASRVEKIVTALALAASVSVGPLIKTLEGQVLAMRNPLFRATILSVEGGPDRRAITDLEAATRKFKDDRDLLYLLALQYKKAGQYDDAGAVYKDILRSDDKDEIALNNLGNLEFARSEFPAAISRYMLAQKAAEGKADNSATIYYNLSLAHLQKFERQDADEARSKADLIAGGLTRSYDVLWKYETKNENAVVDLGLTQDQAWAKFLNTPDGVGIKNIAGRRAPGVDVAALVPSLVNRFAGFVVVFALVVFALGRWRGPRMFTMRCLKCGTPFCKRCHLGAAPAGLCTQCFHLFVVRDGVSGPARNQKLLEVQKEDERRERIFRALSLVSPGAGHLYAQKTVLGILFGLLWYSLLALALLAGRLLPVTGAPAMLSGRWALVIGAALLLATYVIANRARPDFEAPVTLPRRPGRGRPAAA
jgi:Tfp pilus assembly protein PilF